VKPSQAVIAIAGAIRVQAALSMLLNQSRSFRFHLTIKRRKRMEYLIVFSVVAMMTLYVLILARYLRHA
jgi:2'-5' RNA ligase